jgi:hypothetical protein
MDQSHPEQRWADAASSVNCRPKIAKPCGEVGKFQQEQVANEAARPPIPIAQRSPPTLPAADGGTATAALGSSRRFPRRVTQRPTALYPSLFRRLASLGYEGLLVAAILVAGGLAVSRRRGHAGALGTAAGAATGLERALLQTFSSRCWPRTSSAPGSVAGRPSR